MAIEVAEERLRAIPESDVKRLRTKVEKQAPSKENET
jgi:hypothetical protein